MDVLAGTFEGNGNPDVLTGTFEGKWKSGCPDRNVYEIWSYVHMNKTLVFYAENAKAFVADTITVDFSEPADRFLKLMPKGGKILDFGCGSGRDSKYFLEKGYEVTAVDGSKELCSIASAHIGIPVKCMLFQELSEVAVYDGIWACASILHVGKEELPSVFTKMLRALKPGGYIYTSFKYGDFEGERKGRYFSNFTEAAWEAFMLSFPDASLEEMWLTGDVREGRGDERWLNVIVKKKV